MKTKIIANDRMHLKKIIREEIKLNGVKCSLNHIDISNLESLNYVFEKSNFDGDISGWDVSKVTDMAFMFSHSKFNGDISKWDVSNVEEMYCMFAGSSVTCQLSQWKPYKLKNVQDIFFGQPVPTPYWIRYESQEARTQAINSYYLNKQLSADVGINDIVKKKVKL